MLDFPLDDLTDLSKESPFAALVIAISCLHDDLKSLSEQIDDLITAVNGNI